MVDQPVDEVLRVVEDQVMEDQVVEVLPILEYLANQGSPDILAAEEPKAESEIDWEVLIDSIEAMSPDDLIGLAKTAIDRCLRYGYVTSVTDLLPPIAQSPVICFDCGIDIQDSIVCDGKDLCPPCYEDRINKTSRCSACSISGVNLLTGSMGLLCPDCYDDIEPDQ